MTSFPTSSSMANVPRKMSGIIMISIPVSTTIAMIDESPAKCARLSIFPLKSTPQMIARRMVAENLSMSMVYAQRIPRRGAIIKATFLLNFFSSKASSMYLMPAPSIGYESRKNNMF